MPGLSGSDLAYRWAIADEEPRGKTRADSTRAGFFLRNRTPVQINGTNRSGTIQASIRIDLNTGDEPHRCSFDFKGGGGFVPQAGHTVTIGHGTIPNALFSGRLLKVERTTIRNDDRKPTYRCEASGWVFDLNTIRLTRGFFARSLAPHSIVQGILASTTPSASGFGFSAYTDPTLPRQEVFSAGVTESITEILGRLTRAIDGVMFVDHDKTISVVSSLSRGSVDVATITSASTDVFGLSSRYTDLSRVYTMAMVRGAAQATLEDMQPSFHATLPLASASLLGTSVAAFGGGGGTLIYSAEARLIGGIELRAQDGIQTPESHFRAGQTSTFLPMSIQSNTLTVAATNVSLSPLTERRWYTVAGQNIYVSSFLGVFSSTANSIACQYFIPSSRPGAVNTDIPQGTNVTGLWNYVGNFDAFLNDYYPAGTEVQVLSVRGGGSGGTAVGSLFGDGALRNITRVYEDRGLSPTAAGEVADEALERGHPDRWREVSFSTRNRYVEIGRPIYLSVTSLAETSAHSIVGTFVAQDVTIGEFGRLTETQGPIYTVRAGPLRRPTMWQVLQGE